MESFFYYFFYFRVYLDALESHIVAHLCSLCPTLSLYFSEFGSGHPTACSTEEL